VRRFKDEDGNITTKANADMDLAIDALLQARNLDRIILVTGDGDFLRLIIALQNMGCRVEVIGFHNVSKELREVADSYISGFLVPGLLPISGSYGENGDQWQRGTVANFNQERGFGFFRYYRLHQKTLQSETVFFHLSKSTLGSDHFFQEPHRIFEFRVVENPANNNRSEAWDIRLLKEG
jgi:cold shock CspA family protein